MLLRTSRPMDSTLVFMVSAVTFTRIFAQVHIYSPMSGGRACYNDQFEVTCWYPEVTVPGRYLVQKPGWKNNGSVLTLDGSTYQEQQLNSTATKVIVTVNGTFSVNTVVAFSCFLVLTDSQLDESTQQVHIRTMATPNPPAITIMTFLSTSISLNWTHDKTCFESAPVKYHVLVNTETQPIVTDQLTAEIGGIISGTNYTVSVMALVDDSQRSEPDRESVTAGYPSTRGHSPHHCFDRHFTLICHHEYDTTVPHVWCMNGIPVEHDGREFAINHDDRSITLMAVSQSTYGGRNTSFQCCVNLTGGPQVCGEQYIFDPLEHPTAPAVRLVRVEQTSISLSWEVSTTCFESVDFTVAISWSSSSGEGQATNVSGSSYDITGLTPGVRYDIMLVAIGDGVRSDVMSISATTLSSGEGTVHVVSCNATRVDTQGRVCLLYPFTSRWDLPVGAIVWIAISALVVVLGIVTVTVVAVIAGWKRWNHDNGIFDLETDQGQQRSMEELTYITVDHSQPQPIGVHDENLDVQYTGVKFDVSTV